MKYIETLNYGRYRPSVHIYDATGEFMSIDARYSPQENLGPYRVYTEVTLTENFGVVRTYHNRKEYMWRTQNTDGSYNEYTASCLEPYFSEIELPSNGREPIMREVTFLCD